MSKPNELSISELDEYCMTNNVNLRFDRGPIDTEIRFNGGRPLMYTILTHSRGIAVALPNTTQWMEE